VAKKLIPVQVGIDALANPETEMPTAVRYLLQLIETSNPGHSVELRIPPYGAIQCIAGLNHRRGTPPNVVEIKPADFLALCRGELLWQHAIDSGKLIASGTLSDELQRIFPLEF
jgi:hypothetical protein